MDDVDVDGPEVGAIAADVGAHSSSAMNTLRSSNSSSIGGRTRAAARFICNAMRTGGSELVLIGC